jgi:threonine synthase
MDILKSSNVERILFDLFGDQRTKELMNNLEEQNFYELTGLELAKLQECFDADWCNGDEGKAYIKEVFEKDAYLMDPHTATCMKSYESCSNPAIKTIAYSTAEWTKFSPVIANALTGEEDAQDIVALESISKVAQLEIPAMVKGLFTKEIAQKTVIEKEDIEKEILKFL